jgi:hypothetical protein
MLEIASDVVIRLDELTEEYVKLRQTQSKPNEILVEVNGQKAVISITDLLAAISKIQDLHSGE